MSRSLDATAEMRRPDAFCQGEWPLIAELTDGDEVAACYLVQEAKRLETRNQSEYLRLQLCDRTGTIDAVAWDDVERWEPHCTPGAVVGIRGRVGSYQARLQLRVEWVEPLEPAAADLARLIPASPRDRVRMEAELDDLIASVSDRGLNRLLVACLGRRSELGRAFRTHPAAKRNHHAYLSGLLEHSLSVAGSCDALARHYEAQGAPLDRDLLIAGALLHDLGKVRELHGFPETGYTNAGQLLGHIVIGIQLVAEAAAEIEELPTERLLLLQHLIASHQGKPEWDSPKMPQLREALVLHYADDLDAKLNQAGALLDGLAPGEWSRYDRGLARSFFRPPDIKASDEVEPVPSEEAVGLFMDLFHD